MKESMSITYIFQIVILFIFLFAGIMALTINHSNAFGVKDQIVSIIENNNGNYLNADGTFRDEIIELIESTSYRTTGKCDNNFEGYDRTGHHVDSGQNAAVCIKRVNATAGVDNYLTSILGGSVATDDFMPGNYYQVQVFFQLDIPIVNQIYNFSSKAETKVIYAR